ncbi:MAG: DUF1549 domain-containing protein [Chthoniobacter sp.]
MHPIDNLLAGYFAEKGVAYPSAVEDRVFARRVYLDLIGLLPTPEQLETFLRDPAPDKRAQLVASFSATSATTPTTGSPFGMICCAMTTAAPASSTAGASKSPAGSIARCSRTCPTTASSPNW